MKPILTLFFTFAIAASLYGQITLTAEDYASPLGDTIVSYGANLFNVFPPTEGSSQSWDYRWLELLNPQNDPEPETSDANFPTANNVDEIPVTTVFNAEATVPVRFFERYDSEGKALLGRELAVPTAIPFDCAACTEADSIRFEPVINSYEEPEQVLSLPLSFGDSWSSSHTATIDMTVFSPAFSLNDMPARQIDSVTVESEVAGWGTLTLPNLTRSGFQDMEALLVRRTRTVNSHFFIGGVPAPQALLDELGLTQGQEVVTTEYHFYARDLDRPALSLTFGSNGFPLAASVAGKISDINPETEGQFFPVGILHNGSPRAYFVYLPPGYTGAEPAPVVVGLHGYTSYATQFAWQSQLNAIADTAGFIVVYPQGQLVNNSNPPGPFPPQGPGWNIPGTPLTSQNDDVDFINTVVEEVANQFNVDLARIYAAGISNGGFMTSQLACELPGRFAAVGMAAGTIPCERSRNIPTFIIHGTNDLVVPYGGNPDLGVPSVPEIAAFYAGQNGCAATPDSTDLPDIDPTDGTTVTKFTYNGCQEDGDVVFYRVNNGGHVWEGTGPVPPLFQFILGAFVNQDISAGSEMWNFFNQYTHPDPAPVPRLLDLTLEHQDSNRKYLLYVPADYDGSEPWPLVVNMHGLANNRFTQLIGSGMNQIADTAHFLVVYPEATLVQDPVLGAVPSWNPQMLPNRPDDIAFIDELIGTLTEEWNIDETRVYACGMSQGGVMSYLLACNLPDRLAAIASVAGALTLNNDWTCTADRPMPLLHIHGANDLVSPINGGASGLNPLLVFPPLRDQLQSWLDNNGCAADSTVTLLPDLDPNDGSTVELRQFQSCTTYTGADDVERTAEVWYYRIEGGGHTWPDMPAFLIPPGFGPLIGNINRDINAGVEIWNFFNRHVLDKTVSTDVVDPVAFRVNVFPNPFLDQLTFEFELPRSARVQLGLYNALGQPVAQIENGQLPAGPQRMSWNTGGKTLPPGMYFYRLQIDGQVVSRPVVVGR